MILYFEDSKKQRRLISNPTTVDDMWKDIHCYLYEYSYTTPVIKVNFGKDEWIITMNDWDEYFIVKDFDEEDLNDIKGGQNNGSK